VNEESASVTVPPLMSTMPFWCDAQAPPPYRTSAYCNVDVPAPAES
jgi:hypothetical protein